MVFRDIEIDGEKPFTTKVADIPTVKQNEAQNLIIFDHLVIAL